MILRVVGSNPIVRPEKMRSLLVRLFLFMDFHVYILQSEKDGSFYIGQTSNLSERIKRHNAGLEKYTSKKVPWKIFWQTPVLTRSEAMTLEKKLKNLKSTKRMLEFIDTHKVGPAA